MATWLYRHGYALLSWIPCQNNNQKCVTVVRGGALPYLANWVRAAEQGLVFMVLNLKVYYFTISVADLNLQIGRGAVIQPLR